MSSSVDNKFLPYGSSKKRIFSGIQPTGHLHLGNYLGALKRFVTLQDEQDTECIFCIVDLHAITVKHSPASLRKSIIETAAGFLACGLNSEKNIIFNQSSVVAHSELAWLLSCVARYGWLGRMTQFKEKAGKDKENAAVGLFTYPVLMAADILAYRATHVPVGDDQKQHLELARDIAQKFNFDFKNEIDNLNLPENFMVPPEPIIGGPAARVMSLRDGKRKMSKSEPSDMALINLTDDNDIIANKIRKAKSDPLPLPQNSSELEDRPEAKNLVSIMAALQNQSIDEVLQGVGGESFSKFKQELTDALIAVLEPIRIEFNHHMANKEHLQKILAEGSNKAHNISNPIIHDTKRVMGMLPD